MIEVLISILVLAVGAIGAAGMQMAALRTTQQSTFQTTAVELATEMADKMRANSAQMKSVNNLFQGIDFQATVGAAPSKPATMCYGSASCNSEELAKFDLYEWKTRIARELPNGRAVVCQDAAPWSSDAHSLTWSCANSGVNGAGFVIKIGWQAKNPDGTYARDPSGQFPPLIALAVEPYTK